MADHLGEERRRFPRVTVPSASRSTASLVPPPLEASPSDGSLARISAPDAGKAGASRDPMLRLVGLAGLGLALWGGVTFVAVRLAIGSAAWGMGRSGDAVTT
jgi:hypothetical protein